MKLKVWHCYWYGPHETLIILAESNSALQNKVRALIAEGWYPDDQGPMPDDWDALMEAYEDIEGPHGCYFGGWDCAVIDAALCEKVLTDSPAPE